MKNNELIRKDLGNFLYNNLYNYRDIHWGTSTILVTFGNNANRRSEWFYEFTEKEIKKYRKFYEKNFNILELYDL